MEFKILVKRWWFLGAIVFVIFLLVLFLPIPIFHYELASAVSKDCGYSYYVGGGYRGDCSCMGIKVDATSCY